MADRDYAHNNTLSVNIKIYFWTYFSYD